jgi:hypothetical protein
MNGNWRASMSKRFLFVGEKPSSTAELKERVWADGGLAAKQLFDALKANDIEPSTCVFFNLFGDTSHASESYLPMINSRAETIRDIAKVNRLTIVAMGEKVAKHLRYFQVDHRQIVHPAARGLIRAKDRYAEHIRETLT